MYFIQASVVYNLNGMYIWGPYKIWTLDCTGLDSGLDYGLTALKLFGL